MQNVLLILFLIISFHLSAQKKLPVIRASSEDAMIQEGNEEKTYWSLNPKLKPDIYSVSKSRKAKWIRFYTDIDSIKIKLKPNNSFDFVVLLHGKDSCFTRIENPETKNFSYLNPEIHDTIPFLLTEYNNIKLKVTIDEKDTLYLKFDSGATDFLLTTDVIKNTLHINNLANHSFQIGNLVWSNQEIRPVELSGQGTVGRFGWNIFDGKIVEIDYEKKLFIIHSKIPRINKDYAAYKMEYVQGLFCIHGELQIKGVKYKNRFLFDNGYQRTIMLDDDLMQEQNFPKNDLEVIKKVIMRNGQGKEIPVLTVNNEKLNLGNFTLTNIPVQLLSTANPAGFKTHILGNEVLKRFNTILDFQKDIVYLKPNSLHNVSYTEQKSGS